MKPLPRPSERIIEIQERRTNKLLARFNVTRRSIEFQRRGRRSFLRLETLETVDTNEEIVYTEGTSE